MAVLAATFNWPPSELLALTFADLDFWLEQAEWVHRKRNG